MNIDANSSQVLLISSQFPEDQELVKSGVRFLQTAQRPCAWIAIAEDGAEQPIVRLAEGMEPEELTAERLAQAFEQAAHVFWAISIDLACAIYENGAVARLLKTLTPVVAGKFLSAAIRYCDAQNIAVSFGFNPGLIPVPKPLIDFPEATQSIWWQDYILPHLK